MAEYKDALKKSNEKYKKVIEIHNDEQLRNFTESHRNLRLLQSKYRKGKQIFLEYSPDGFTHRLWESSGFDMRSNWQKFVVEGDLLRTDATNTPYGNHPSKAFFYYWDLPVSEIEKKIEEEIRRLA